MISRARFSFRPRLRLFPAREIRPERLLVVEEEQHRRMLLDRLQHVGETPEHMRADRLALERAGPHPRQRALVGGDAEMIGPERHQPLGKPAIGDDAALQPRQRLGAEGFLDDVERRWRWPRGIGPHALRRAPSPPRRFSAGCVCIDGSLAAMSMAMLLSDRFRRCAFASGGGCRFGRGRRRAALAAASRRLLNLELIVEHRLAERRRRLQTGHFEQRAVGTRRAPP